MVFRCASAILQLFESSADMRIAKLSILESLFCLYYISCCLETPLGVKYDKSKVPVSTRIECEILFYNDYNNAVIRFM